MLTARFDGDDLAVVERDRPEPATDEVLVEVRAASICGSDLNYLKGKTDPGNVPLTLGHEGAGVVAATGDDVDHVDEGDRVVVHYVESCDRCDPCLAGHDNRCRNRQSVGHHVDGTFAEYVAVPARNALELPDGVSFAWGSVAGCAVATGFHAATRADVDPGDTVVVFGAGGVGLHAIMWADFFGAAKTIAVDLSAPQLEAAAEYGADVAVDPTEADVADAIAAETDGWGADAAIECSGSPVAMADAVDAINGANGYESGTVVSVGIQTEPIEVGFGDVREGQLRVAGDHTRDELRRVLRLLETGAVDLSPSITDTVALADIRDGIDLATAEDERVCRIVVEP